MDDMRQLDRAAYTVLWIAPVEIEAYAAYAALDVEHDGDFPAIDGQRCIVTPGEICGHNVVIATLPAGTEYGTAAAAALASEMEKSFPCLRYVLLVGIAAGLPKSEVPNQDIRLGDVLVAYSNNDERVPVVAYDLGRDTGQPHINLLFAGRLLQRTKDLIRSAFTKLKSDGDATNGATVLMPYYNTMKDNRVPRNHSWQYPGNDKDRYFEVDNQGNQRLVTRNPRPDSERTQVWYGPLGSGNLLIKNWRKRNELRDEHKLIGLEMEAAGVLSQLPAGVIRGVSDYGDEEKNKIFQPYAAIMAACYAKAVLRKLPRPQVNTTALHPSTMQTTATPCLAKRPREEVPDSDSASRAKRGRTEELDLESQKPSQNGGQRDERRKKLLKSLEFPTIDRRRNTMGREYRRTCQWLLEAAEYHLWLEVGKLGEILVIEGKPGAGKSILMKFAVLEAEKKRGTIVISFFFHAQGAELQRSTTGMYRSLLAQLMRKVEPLQEFLDSFENGLESEETSEWNLEVLKFLFEGAIMKLGKRPLMIFIDALDEGDETQIREMVEFLQDMSMRARKEGIELQICFTKRDHPVIAILNKIELTLTTHEGHNNDLKFFIEEKLKPRIKSPEDFQRVRDKLLAKAQGVFMWLRFVLPRVTQQYDHGKPVEAEEEIQKAPGELHALYKDIIETREPNPSDELLLCLQWILFARQPLSPTQLQDAILSGLVTTTPKSHWFYRYYSEDPNSIEAIEENACKFIISCSKGLAETVESDKTTTKSGRRQMVAQFVHESVRDFLLGSNAWRECLVTFWPGFAQNFKGESHNTLKQCCSRYIRLSRCKAAAESFRVPEKAYDKTPERCETAESFPLLEYAVDNILHHADTADGSGVSQEAFIREAEFSSVELEQLACQAQGSDVSLEEFFRAAEGRGVSLEDFVHAAEGRGVSLEAFVREAEGSGASLEAFVLEAEGRGVSLQALVGGAVSRSIKLKRFVYETECNDTRFPHQEWISRHWNLCNHECRRYSLDTRLLYILSMYDAANLINRHPYKSMGFEQGGERFCMPLMAAVFSGSHRARHALMKAYADSRNDDAVRNKLHTLCEKFLTDKKPPRPKLTDVYTSTLKSVLRNVFLTGDESFCNFAIAANFSAKQDGWEVLRSAAKAENEGLFRQLVGAGAASKKPRKRPSSKFCEEAVRWAVTNGLHDTVEEFVGNDIQSVTLLLRWAAINDDEPLVERLLRFSPDTSEGDQKGWTPLMWAVRRGNLAIVGRILHERTRRRSAANADSIMALWCVICRLNAAEKRVQPGSAVDVTPQEMGMYQATWMGILTPPPDAHRPNFGNNIALFVAALVGDVELARFSVDAGADINLRYTTGLTLLMCALQMAQQGQAWYRHVFGHLHEPTHYSQRCLAKFLLENNADINASDANGHTALMLAVFHQDRWWAFDFLLEHKADINISTGNGETALTCAVSARNHRALQLLLASCRATARNLDAALFKAREAGDEAAVRLIGSYAHGPLALRIREAGPDAR